MLWRGFFIDKNIDKPTLHDILCEVFNVDRTRVNIVDDLSECKSNDIITCTMVETKGIFCLWLDFLTAFKVDNEFKIIFTLCQKLNCQAITINEDSYKDSTFSSFLLFNQNNEAYNILAKIEDTEESTEIKIIRILEKIS
jgi:hypothetical protein